MSKIETNLPYDEEFDKWCKRHSDILSPSISTLETCRKDYEHYVRTALYNLYLTGIQVGQKSFLTK